MDTPRPLIALAALLALAASQGCATGTLTIGGIGDEGDGTADGDDDDAADDDAADDDAADDDAADDDAADDDAADDDAADDDTTDTSVYDGAGLYILSPPTGYEGVAGDLAVSAEVRSAAGEVLDFDGVQWSLDAAGPVLATGLHTVLDDLAPGEYRIVATAHLPNGETATAAAEDVLLRSPYAGSYEGTVEALVYTDWFELPCVGDVEGEVDDFGETLTGSGVCSFAEGYDWAATDMEFTAELAGAAFEGVVTVVMDLGWTVETYDLDLSGSINGAQELVGEYGYESEWLWVAGAIEMST